MILSLIFTVSFSWAQNSSVTSSSRKTPTSFIIKGPAVGLRYDTLKEKENSKTSANAELSGLDVGYSWINKNKFGFQTKASYLKRFTESEALDNRNIVMMIVSANATYGFEQLYLFLGLNFDKFLAPQSYADQLGLGNGYQLGLGRALTSQLSLSLAYQQYHHKVSLANAQGVSYGDLESTWTGLGLAAQYNF